jgi:hypothetical protein
MAESQKKKPAVVAKAGIDSADDIDLVIKRIVTYLDSASQNPVEDADRINSVVNDYRSHYVRAERSPSCTPSEEIPEMFKDEPTPASNSVSTTQTSGQPEASPELRELLDAVVDDPQKWLATPSMQFGGRRPAELVGTDEEPKIFDLLHAVEQGLF